MSLLSSVKMFISKEEGKVMNPLQVLQQANNTLQATGNIANDIGDLAQALPGAQGIAAAAKGVGDIASNATAIESAVESFAGALLPLLIAAGHDVASLWPHVTGAAKVVVSSTNQVNQ